jgi:lipopolysaccharide/colanic/teichoic acid biosynthesis glycosyltransferase
MHHPSSALESGSLAAPVLAVTARPYGKDGAPDREERLESPTASEWSLSDFKRLFDLMAAVLVLVFMGIPMLAIALCVRLSSRGPALFVQNRVGREGRLFRMYKFRSMALDAEKNGPGLTREGDSRITRVGRWLRKLKIDELPQFYNVLRGDMSLVGPRPKLPRYAGIVNMPYRPGITGEATLAFRCEEEILSRVHPAQLEYFYNRHIRQLKARMDVRYMCRATFWSDIRLLGRTFQACMGPAYAINHVSSAPILPFSPRLERESSIGHAFDAAD